MSELKLRYMHVNDLAEIVAIDQVSFNPPWPERSYRFEINESQISHMVVLEKPELRPVEGFKGILRRLRGAEAIEHQSVVVAYGGLWKIAEEAHISTIASHPQYRGKKYGEVVLAGMIQRSIHLGASYVVLEVRVSNTVAQNLYQKYGFSIEGIKPEYYHYDHEDAYDMRLELNPATIASFQARYSALRQKIHFKDTYSVTTHPRLGY